MVIHHILYVHTSDVHHTNVGATGLVARSNNGWSNNGWSPHHTIYVGIGRPFNRNVGATGLVARSNNARPNNGGPTMNGPITLGPITDGLCNAHSINTRFIITQLPTNNIVLHNNVAIMIGPGDQTGRPYIIIWVSHALQFCNSLLKCKQTQINTRFSPQHSIPIHHFPPVSPSHLRNNPRKTCCKTYL